MWDKAGHQVGAPQSVPACFICGVDYIPQSELLVVGGAWHWAAVASGRSAWTTQRDGWPRNVTDALLLTLARWTPFPVHSNRQPRNGIVCSSISDEWMLD